MDISRRQFLKVTGSAMVAPLAKSADSLVPAQLSSGCSYGEHAYSQYVYSGECILTPIDGLTADAHTNTSATVVTVATGVVALVTLGLMREAA